MIISAEELFKQCQEAIGHHVQRGGRIEQGKFGWVKVIDGKDISLKDNCGCGLTILAYDEYLHGKADLDFNFLSIMAGFTDGHTDGDYLVDEVIPKCRERSAFISGFDSGGPRLGRLDANDYSSPGYFEAGRDLINWVVETYPTALV